MCVRAAAPSADYTGPAVCLAERLAEAAHGGQVLLSEEAWQSVQDLLQVREREGEEYLWVDPLRTDEHQLISPAFHVMRR